MTTYPKEGADSPPDCNIHTADSCLQTHVDSQNTLRELLVAEDNPDDLFFLQCAVARAGLAELTTFLVDGGQVIRYLAAATTSLPKLILLDLAMPTASGFDVLKWMQTQTGLGEVAVIVFT